MTASVSLVPLSSQHHVGALQQVYRSVPGFWLMYGQAEAPDGQAQRDLQEAGSTPGRTMMGIVRRLQVDEPQADFEMVGVIDFRLHWPRHELAYLAMVMVAEPLQRQGIGSQAWRLLREWLANGARVEAVRLGVEQFNPGALRFFRSIGFALTGETNRVSVGRKWIRILYMEQRLMRASVPDPADSPSPP